MATTLVAFVSPCVSYLLMTYGPPSYLWVLENPTAGHLSAAVSSLCITKVKSYDVTADVIKDNWAIKWPCKLQILQHVFNLHLNCGLKSSSQAVVMQSRSTERR